VTPAPEINTFPFIISTVVIFKAGILYAELVL
jgi:hypothetical protein